MTQLRVTHVVASVDDVSAGPSYSVTRLACELGLLGAEVIVRSVAGWRGFSPREAAPRAKVPFATIRSALDGDPISRRVCGSRELEDALREDARKADILHTHGLWLMPNVYPSSAARRPSARAAVVLSPRGTLGEAALAFSPRKKQLFWHFLQKRAVANVALLHATSEAEVADIRAFGLRHPVAVIPNGIDLPEPAEASPRKPEILYLGRVHPKKGIDVLIRAWALIAEKRPNWSIRIVGPAEGGHDEDMRRLAAETGAPRVSIEGPAYGPARLAAYREASLFVLPNSPRELRVGRCRSPGGRAAGYRFAWSAVAGAGERTLRMVDRARCRTARQGNRTGDGGECRGARRDGQARPGVDGARL